MVNAATPPELPPIVARASGSLVSFTLYLLLDQRQHFRFDELGIVPDIVSYSRPRWLPCASPLPLAMEIAIITGTRFWAIRLSSAVNSSGPDRPRRR